MRIAIAIISFIALIGAIIWWIAVPDWEPAVTSIALFGALLAQISTSDEIKSKIKFAQKSGKDSHNYQASGNQTITDNKKIQKVNNNTQLMQADQMTVNFGIDEKRAREIYTEMSLQMRKDYTIEAWTVLTSRVSEFENSLLKKMEKVDGALEAFADPGFQLLLVEAQKTAAATERLEDYDLLSELLIHRFQKGSNRNIRAGVSRAVEIVDKISDDALLGLTVSHAITTFLPKSGDPYQGLDVLDDLTGNLIYGTLPLGKDWLDHLDILDAVRFNTTGNLKKVQQYFPEILTGYIDVGIEKQSRNHRKAISILNQYNLPQETLVDHAFDPNFLRISIRNRKSIDSLTLIHQRNQSGKIIEISVPLSEDQKKAIYSVYDLYKQDNEVKNENIKKFMEEWNKRPNLRKFKEWWDNIGGSFQVTSVGKVLAHSNAQRCHKSLPPFD